MNSGLSSQSNASLVAASIHDTRQRKLASSADPVFAAIDAHVISRDAYDRATDDEGEVWMGPPSVLVRDGLGKVVIAKSHEEIDAYFEARDASVFARMGTVEDREYYRRQLDENIERFESEAPRRNEIIDLVVRTKSEMDRAERALVTTTPTTLSGRAAFLAHVLRVVKPDVHELDAPLLEAALSAYETE